MSCLGLVLCAFPDILKAVLYELLWQPLQCSSQCLCPSFLSLPISRAMKIFACLSAMICGWVCHYMSVTHKIRQVILLYWTKGWLDFREMSRGRINTFPCIDIQFFRQTNILKETEQMYKNVTLCSNLIPYMVLKDTVLPLRKLRSEIQKVSCTVANFLSLFP